MPTMQAARTKDFDSDQGHLARNHLGSVTILLKTGAYMFHRVMIPTDLAHTEKLTKAITLAGELAQQHGAEIVYVGVTASAPSAIAHSEQEFAEKLDAFAEGQKKTFKVPVATRTINCHDPAVELHPALIDASQTIGADVIVMASHVPGMREHFLSSNAGYVASHAPISVFVVR